MVRRSPRANPYPSTSPATDPSPPTRANPQVIRRSARRWSRSDSSICPALKFRSSWQAIKGGPRSSRTRSSGGRPARQAAR